jgi:hypothetical protein
MSKRIFTIDKTLHEIFSEYPGHGFRLHELRVEYSSRSVERDLPVRKELFWQIFMHVEALKIRRLIRREDSPSGGGGGILFIEPRFWDYPFNVVDGLLAKRGLMLRGEKVPRESNSRQQ